MIWLITGLNYMGARKHLTSDADGMGGQQILVRLQYDDSDEDNKIELTGNKVGVLYNYLAQCRVY